ncbi:hypothetical protein N5K21_27955 [Rhizobium pusense]|uniref:Uncharacterized protein n=1 Tax=Agrobacterium pusense TaxID=648995 RepID=A0A6H0ZQG6_9HYPH|nr:hypothetical protein [Agrobacterium pusense]MDH2092552.1 hypothetical protein [Agrobacterium pusense]QIX22111.1 hypothetical protein FOB41_13620 [Agrobacterium pusense]WCK23996.1 hypothetical protein CFBP5496_0014955 [Agrobacterium pusense]
MAALGLSLFALASNATPLLWQVATLTVAGFGLGGIMSVGSTSIMRRTA